MMRLDLSFYPPPTGAVQPRMDAFDSAIMQNYRRDRVAIRLPIGHNITRGFVIRNQEKRNEKVRSLCLLVDGMGFLAGRGG
jgi:hypothetical protein